MCATQTHGGVEEQFHSFLISVLDGCKWSASFPYLIQPMERIPGTPCREGWVSTGASLDTLEKQSFSCSSQKENDTSDVQPVA